MKTEFKSAKSYPPNGPKEKIETTDMSDWELYRLETEDGCLYFKGKIIIAEADKEGEQ